MERLPIEIIEKILTYSTISIEDVVHFAITCHQLNDIVMNSNMIWKNKFFQKWKCFKKLENKLKSYHTEVKYLYELKQRIRQMLEAMSPKFNKTFQISDSELPEWTALVSERDENYTYLVYYLMEITDSKVPINTIKPVPFNTPGNRTAQYYATKVLRLIRQRHLANVWNDYISLPESRQLMEVGACILAQWGQPTVEVVVEDIMHQLDEIADTVKEVLRSSHPKHPLFKASQEDLNKWRTEKLTDNQWGIIPCRDLLDVLRGVLFQQLGFTGNNEDYYDPRNSFINEVLERRQGLPITLAIVFEGVARRLGLRCEPISFPAHFLLRFCESSEPRSEWYYIDVFNGGQIVSKGACPHSRFSSCREMFPVATSLQVMERMANNLEVSARQHGEANGRISRLRCALELLKVVSPTDISALVSLSRIYMLHNLDTKPLEQFLLTQEFEVPEQAERIVQLLRDYEAHHNYGHRNFLTPHTDVAPKRKPDMLYAVGLPVRYLDMDVTGVIYDWDPVCMAAYEWQDLNCRHLRLGANQPFYNVLVLDGAHKYIAQETLAPATDAEAEAIGVNEDIGRYFSHFFETHFVPNTEKAWEYPEDQEARERYHQNQKMKSTSL